MKQRSCCPLGIVLLMLLTGCAPATRSKTPSPLLVGAWRSKIEFKDGAFAGLKGFEILYAFNEGGTIVESSNYDEVPPVPPGYGIWRESGAREYEAKYVFTITKPPAKLDALVQGSGWLPNGHGELTERLTLAADGDTYTSAITYAAFDSAGKPAPGGGSGVGHGTRVTF